MDSKAEKYLEVVNRHLQSLTLSERTDIISEIKSHIQEKQIRQQVDIDTILKNMGEPVDLAKAYIGESIVKNTNFNFRNLLRIISFYGITGFSGMIVIPFLAVLAASLYLCTFIVLIAGIIKTIANLAGVDLPFVIMSIGGWEPTGLLVLPITILFAALFYFLSRKLWKALKKYLEKVNQKHQAFKKKSSS